MSDSYLAGTDWLLLIDPTNAGTFKPVACLTTNDLDSTLSELDVSSKCQPGGYFIPASKFEDKITGSGFAVDQSGSPSKESYNQLWALYEAKTQFPARFGKMNPITGEYYYQGNVFIMHMKLTAPYNEATKFDIDMRVIAPPMPIYPAY